MTIKVLRSMKNDAYRLSIFQGRSKVTFSDSTNSADTVMRLFKNWIEDYNNIAPHSGLGMKSPVEYRKLMNQAV